MYNEVKPDFDWLGSTVRQYIVNVLSNEGVAIEEPAGDYVDDKIVSMQHFYSYTVVEVEYEPIPGRKCYGGLIIHELFPQEAEDRGYRYKVKIAGSRWA